MLRWNRRALLNYTQCWTGKGKQESVDAKGEARGRSGSSQGVLHPVKPLSQKEGKKGSLLLGEGPVGAWRGKQGLFQFVS